MQLIRDMLANDGVSQEDVARSVHDQSKESDRRSRNEAMLGFDGANQWGSATATSTRSRRCRRPEPRAVIKDRITREIYTELRVKEQKKQVEAINAAAEKSDVVEDATNPLYCIICTYVCDEEGDMRGFVCRVREHFVCRT